MASIHRDPRFPRGVWYAHYTLADGRRACRSTGKQNKIEARIIAEAWQSAENEAAGGHLTKDRVTEILNETLKRIGSTVIRRINVDDWLNDWLASCEGSVKTATLLGYQQAVRDFLAFLGERRRKLSLGAITQAEINAFKDSLLEEGRSPSTVNKLIKKYLNTSFELARKSGKISFNPIHLYKRLKVESVTKGRFTH